MDSPPPPSQTIVPLDSTLFTPNLGSAFGLPGFCSVSGGSKHGLPSQPPSSFASLGGANKPVGRFGGAAKVSLLWHLLPGLLHHH